MKELVAAAKKLLPAWVQHASRWALCGVLVLSAAAKLLTPYQESYVVPEALYYIVSLVELAAAVLLHLNHSRYAIATALVLALGGISLPVVVPSGLCGCFGSLLPLEGRNHVLASGVVGALACLSWWTEAGRRSPPSAEAHH